MLDCFKEPLAQDRCAGGGAEATIAGAHGASAHFHLITPISLNQKIGIILAWGARPQGEAAATELRKSLSETQQK